MSRRLQTLLLTFALALPLHAKTVRVTLLHFSDYHSHAVPFRSEGREDQGGIARAIRYMERERSRGALVFSGGDMVNRGAPAWSDKYRCAEWSWFNGVVDAMAYGNHDSDYGAAELTRCAAEVKYPILSGNVVDAAGKLLFVSKEGHPYAVFTKNGVRIGVFALAGSDFGVLVKGATLPADGARFTDRIAAAKEIVHALRDGEKADAVVFIGHESITDDFELAKAVPGIDLIFGTHSHLKRDFQQIPGTGTWFLSPFQYLTYVSRVTMTFDGHRLKKTEGKLVRIGRGDAESAPVAKKVATMEKELEADPAYAPLFRTVGRAATALDVDGVQTGDSPLSDYVLDVVRRSANVDIVLSTASSFRQSISAGPIRFEDLRNALPYENELIVYRMTGAQLRSLLTDAASRVGTDFFPQLSGARLVVGKDGTLRSAEVQWPDGAWVPINDQSTYRVAPTDYVARVAPGYREHFAGLTGAPSGVKVRAETERVIEAAESPVRASADGRVRVEDDGVQRSANDPQSRPHGTKE